MVSESSPGRWAVPQLPCCPSKQGELSENILQNLRNKLPPQTVYNVRHPLKNLSSVEFVFGVEPVIDVTALFDITASTFQVV